MTRQELKTIRNKLGLTQQGLGFWVNPHVKHAGREVRRWESGEYTIPGYIETIMKMFDAGAVPVHIK